MINTKKSISSLSKFVTSDPDEKIGTVLPLVKSSHEPILVFKNDKFMGLVSPHLTLYKKRLPYATKVSAILFQPPFITNETPLYEIAEHMLSNRIYSLPVFEQGGAIAGVIEAKEIFKKILEDTELLKSISKSLIIKTPITTHVSSSVKEVYGLMREKDVSRVVLVDDEGDLCGIVARSDLMKAFMTPTSKQRFGKNGNKSTDWAFDEEKKYRGDEPIKKYYKKFVETLSYKTSIEKTVRQLISSIHNSIVLTNMNNKPVGFISSHDLLIALASLKPQQEMHLIMNKPIKVVSQEEINNAEEHLIRFGRKMSKRNAVKQMEVTCEIPKYPGGKPALFNITLILTPFAGKNIISKTKSKTFILGINEAIKQIEKQIRRSKKSEI